MIEVCTYLRKNGVLVPLEEFRGPVADVEYIEGAIELRVNGKELLSQEMWDYVDQLWSYLVDGLAEASQGRAFKTYFPDQPIEVVFTPDATERQIEVQVTCNSTRSVTVCRREFVHAMLAEARRFFGKMIVEIPGNREVDRMVLRKVEELMSVE